MAHSTVGKRRFGSYTRRRFGKESFASKKLDDLLRIGGLTFYKEYVGDNPSLSGHYSKGSVASTYSVARSASAPATYVDGNGKVNLLTTSNARRLRGGYYDATGFHVQAGELIEASTTNVLTQSSTFNNVAWTGTSVTADDADAGSTAPDGTAVTSSITATAGNATGTQAFVDAAAGLYTASVWLKRKTGSGTINLRANTGDSYTAVTVTSSWGRFQVTSSSLTNPTFDIQIVTSGDAVYIYGAQLEKKPYATSYVPTTSSALTRAAEVILYPIANNRTAAVESIIIKFAPNSNFANDGVRRNLITAETKNRPIRKETTLTVLQFAPNSTDSGSSGIEGTTNILANVSYVVAGVAYGETAGSNEEIYVGGVSEGVGVNNYIANAWGTSFGVGAFTDGTTNLNGVIQAVAIYNRALTATEIANATKALNSGGI